MQRRVPLQPGATASGELHDDKTQIYIILAGAGTIQLGGKPDVDNSAGPGEHRGGPLVGTTSHPREGRRRHLDSAADLARVVRRSRTDDELLDGAHREPPDDPLGTPIAEEVGWPFQGRLAGLKAPPYRKAK